ncbi:hypothetical protein AZKH_3225 [Azoarcus sp. KH32C]|nr:hypothetical protein AZKH_3225 [Azoarcus sp. KH32C]
MTRRAAPVSEDSEHAFGASALMEGSHCEFSFAPTYQLVLSFIAYVTTIGVMRVIASLRTNWRKRRTCSAAPATRRDSMAAESSGMARAMSVAVMVAALINSTKVAPRWTVRWLMYDE